MFNESFWVSLQIVRCFRPRTDIFFCFAYNFVFIICHLKFVKSHCQFQIVFLKNSILFLPVLVILHQPYWDLICLLINYYSLVIYINWNKITCQIAGLKKVIYCFVICNTSVWQVFFSVFLSETKVSKNIFWYSLSVLSCWRAIVHAAFLSRIGFLARAKIKSCILNYFLKTLIHIWTN